MQGRGGVAGFHSGQRVAVERKTVRTNERTAEAGAGHEHHHRNFFVAAREPRLGHAAIIAVVANDEWNSATGLFGQCGTVIEMCIRDSIYFSTNSGSTWTSNSFPTYVSAMAASADGTKLFAVFDGGGISIGQLIVPAQNFTAATGGSGLHLQFTGAPNCPYILLATTNLAPPSIWQPVVTNSTDANGNWSFTDTNVNQYSQRFYRASQ